MGLLGRFFDGTRRDALDAVAGAEVVREGHARGMGLERGGAGTMRGNGHLVLAGHELVFVLAVPRRTLRIPRERILAVDVTRRHAGRAGGHWVRVRFADELGQEDAFAFEPVHRRGELDAWVAALAPG